MSLSGEVDGAGTMRLDEEAAAAISTAARKRAAVEMIASEGRELRKAARRYSLCEQDAEDAFQRALEIALVKAPSDRPRDLIRWTKTVVKHEALAIRRKRERLLGAPASAMRAREDGEGDPTALIPALGDGPDERVQHREHLARSREALRSLKPAELRALTLLAAGYSYAEIAEITGFSRTKVNRCLAEGRGRFRRLVVRSEDGSRCAEMRPLLSAFCDGEASGEDVAEVREHLRACAGCRATMRAYRAAPAAVAALAPALPASPSLLERAQELLVGIQSRLAGTGGATADAGIAQVAAAGGARGAGVAAMAKLLAVCAGTVGGAAACVASGVGPAPPDLTPEQMREPRIERISQLLIEESAPPAVRYEPAPAPPPPQPEPQVRQPAEQQPAAPEPEVSAVEAGAVEYAPLPATPPATPSSGDSSGASSGSAAGEFGP